MLQKIQNIFYKTQKKIWKHFRPKIFSTSTNNLHGKIQIASFMIQKWPFYDHFWSLFCKVVHGCLGYNAN